MKRFYTVLKLVVSALLISYILYKYRIDDIAAVLKDANYFWLGAAFLFGELIILSQALRWNYLLIVDKKPTFRELLKYTLVGYFFNPVVPGGIGADVYRSVALGRAHNVIKESVASIALTRIFGLIALCLLFWIGFCYTDVPREAVYFILLCNFCLVLFCVLFFYNPLGNSGRVGKLLEKIKVYGHYKKRLALAMFGSVFMQCLAVLMQYSLFMSVGIQQPFGLLFVIVPVTALAVTVPVSFNGIGVREWCMLALTGSVIGSNELLASLLLGYAVVIMQAAQGGIFYVISHDRIRV